MKVVFYASDKPREHMVAEAFEQGVVKAGDTYEIRRTADYGDDRLYEGPTPDTDVACVFGVKGQSRTIIDDHLARGRATVYVDKGLTRDKGEAGHTFYSRMVVNGADATPYFMNRKRTDDRFKQWRMVVDKRLKDRGGHILFCGSSQKYHDFHKLGDATQYAENVIRKLRRMTTRQIVYRPKPSWRDAVPIANVSFSNGDSTLQDALRGGYCLITHGSNAAVHAILHGIPCIILGDGIAKPVSETDMTKVDALFWADDDTRQEWANALAYTQFSADEMRNGFAWSELKSIIKRA